MDLTTLADGELLDRRNQAFLRISGASAPHSDRADAYDEIRLINRELRRRRCRAALQEAHGAADET